jgi:MOSC domain-containing protein YiiM
MQGRVVSVQVGAVRTLGDTTSAFVKTPVAGPVAVGRLGLKGDHQADGRVHGGPEKAVYVYCIERYPLWRARFPALAGMFVPGGLGENLSVEGVDEEALFVGDVFQAGAAVLQISEPRIPCHKIALRFGDAQVGRVMAQTGWRGFYCRVIEDGVVQAGDDFRMVARHNDDAPLTQAKPGKLSGHLAAMIG